MRKLFKEFFYVPKYGKVREKAMLAHVALSVIIIVMCLVAMCGTAYAFFSCNITSGSSIIKIANFETQVAVQVIDNEGNVVDNSQITPMTSDHKNFRIEGLEVGKYYTVTITHTSNSTAKTGFVVVTADNCLNTYHTQQLAKDVNMEGGQTPALSFKLMITDASTVYLLAHWGTSSYYDVYKEKGDQEELYITQNEEIKMIIKADSKHHLNMNAGFHTENKEPTSTTPPTQAATVTETPSTQATEAMTDPPTETTKPPETTQPEATETSEPVSITEMSEATTEPATMQPTASTETSGTEETRPPTEATDTTDATDATDAPTTETNHA